MKKKIREGIHKENAIPLYNVILKEKDEEKVAMKLEGTSIDFILNNFEDVDIGCLRQESDSYFDCSMSLLEIIQNQIIKGNWETIPEFTQDLELSFYNTNNLDSKTRNDKVFKSYSDGIIDTSVHPSIISAPTEDKKIYRKSKSRNYLNLDFSYPLTKYDNILIEFGDMNEPKVPKKLKFKKKTRVPSIIITSDENNELNTSSEKISLDNIIPENDSLPSEIIIPNVDEKIMVEENDSISSEKILPTENVISENDNTLSSENIIPNVGEKIIIEENDTPKDIPAIPDVDEKKIIEENAPMTKENVKPDVSNTLTYPNYNTDILDNNLREKELYDITKKRLSNGFI